MTGVSRGTRVAAGLLAMLGLGALIAVASVDAAAVVVIALGGCAFLAAAGAVLLLWTRGRRVPAAAGLPAGGDRPARRPASGTSETIVLDHAFNAMSSSLRRSRDELRRLADEQAALRRMATLVANGEHPSMVFAAGTKEVGNILGADITRMLRYEPDETTTVVGAWGGPEDVLPLDTRWTIVGRNLPSMVLRRQAPARMDCFIGALSPLCVYLREHGIRSGVGTPIIVRGKCWGVMLAFSTREHLLPRDAQARISDFTDLVASAIANAQARAELTASRARIVAVTDQVRRRIERDLHDGTQQRLVSLVMDLRSVEKSVPPDARDLRTRLSEVAAGLTAALNDLRETARGVHPPILSEGGLDPAINGLAGRSTIPVELDAHIGRRLPETVEVAAYYVVAESLANAAKHAQASVVRVQAQVEGDRLCLSVRDNGVGGADPVRGSGLIGLVDRVEALNGSIKITSPPGRGTLLQLELPIAYH